MLSCCRPTCVTCTWKAASTQHACSPLQKKGKLKKETVKRAILLCPGLTVNFSLLLQHLSQRRHAFSVSRWNLRDKRDSGLFLSWQPHPCACTISRAMCSIKLGHVHHHGLAHSVDWTWSRKRGCAWCYHLGPSMRILPMTGDSCPPRRVLENSSHLSFEAQTKHQLGR